MTATPLYATSRTTSRKTMVGPAKKLARALGLELMPWQIHGVELFTELDDRGFYAFSDATLLVPRQNGKSTLLLILLLTRALGTGGSRCGYGAQSLKDARKMLLEVWVPLLDASPLKGTYSVRAANGSEAIRFSNGSVIELLVSTSTKAQHGQQFDFCVLDEAFAQVDSRVEVSVLPSFATRTTLRPGVQWLVVSTAGTKSASPYLLERVESRRQLVDAGVTSGQAYIEYSVPDGADYTDPATWASCNPALGITITEDAITAEVGSLGEAEFRRSRLCQWTTQQHDRVVSLEVWDALCDPSSACGNRITLAFDSAPDGASSSIAVASRRDDGLIHVEVIDNQPGTAWLVSEVARLARVHNPDDILMDPKTPAKAALPLLTDLGVRVTEITPMDVTQSYAMFIEACTEATIRHINQPELNAALAGAVRRNVGDASAWSRRSSSVDISSLCACTIAVWGVITRGGPGVGVTSLTEVAEQMYREGRGLKPPWFGGGAPLGEVRYYTPGVGYDRSQGVNPAELHIPSPSTTEAAP
jgi:Phage Terminase